MGEFNIHMDIDNDTLETEFTSLLDFNWLQSVCTWTHSLFFYHNLGLDMALKLKMH